MGIQEFRALRTDFELLRRRFEDSKDIHERRRILQQVTEVIGKVDRLIRSGTAGRDSIPEAARGPRVRQP